MKLTRSALLATAFTVAVGLTVGLTAGAGASTDEVVSYHGYKFVVPTGWPVIDLAKDPTACVRFDRPAVYLGTPGDQQNCPSHLVGRTAGVLVEPLKQATVRPQVAKAAAGAVAAGAASVDGEIQVAVEKAGVLVTAFHAPAQEQTVRKVLENAQLTSGGEFTALTTPPTPRMQAAAAPLVTPGTVKGEAFDACTAPAQATMDAWKPSFLAVGIYISGNTRACPVQPNLTPTWVAANAAKGWKFLPLDVGKQAPCAPYADKISVVPATALSEGRQAAVRAAQAATALGIGARSTLYTDIELYTSTASCKAAVLSYISGWTIELNNRGYLGGAYVNASSGAKDLSEAYNDTRYTRPDSIWFAWWNGAADTKGGQWVPDTLWTNHQRSHQYRGDHDETHGGFTVNIDSNYVDLTAPPPGVSGFDATGGYTAALLRWANPAISDLGQIVVRRNTGTTPPTSPTTGTAVYAGTGTSAIVNGLTPGSTYTFRAWVKDKSGKFGPPADTRLVGTKITTTVSPTALTVGGSTRINGRITRVDTGAILAGVPLNLYRKQKGATAWQLITTVKTTATGTVSYLHKPVWSQDYQWGFAGSPDLLGTRSASAAVGVRTIVSANVSKTTFALGGSVLFYGSVQPAHPGQAVYLQRWINGVWTHVTAGKLTANSTYMFTIKPTVRGQYAYRVAKPGDVDHLTSISPMKVFKVS